MSTRGFIALHIAIFGGAGVLARDSGYAALCWVTFAVGAIIIYERLHSPGARWRR